MSFMDFRALTRYRARENWAVVWATREVCQSSPILVDRVLTNTCGIDTTVTSTFTYARFTVIETAREKRRREGLRVP